MPELPDSDTTKFNYVQPFKDLPYDPKNWYLSIFKIFPRKHYPRGFYNVAIRPLANIIKGPKDTV